MTGGWYVCIMDMGRDDGRDSEYSRWNVCELRLGVGESRAVVDAP